MLTASCRTRFLGSDPSPEGSAGCPESSELHEAAIRRLAATGYAELRTLNVTVMGRKIVLRGTTRSFYMKQVAQSIAAAVPGVEGVCNEIEVLSPRRA